MKPSSRFFIFAAIWPILTMAITGFAASPTPVANPNARQVNKQPTITLDEQPSSLFPDPFFADLYLSPFYTTRFGTWIFFGQARAGIKYGSKEQGRLYSFVSQNQDLRSTMHSDHLTFIDNALIVGAGSTYQFLDFFSVFLELGRAYNYVTPNKQPRWQNDLRSGLEVYKDWRSKLQLGEIYGSIAYYSRYKNDWIGFLQGREGLRMLNFQHSDLNLFVEGFISKDIRGDFFNNQAQLGSGIAFTPDSRRDLTIRLKFVHVMFLPGDEERFPNPYGKAYNEIILEFETFLSI
jgi:hypothetical protein